MRQTWLLKPHCGASGTPCNNTTGFLIVTGRGKPSCPGHPQRLCFKVLKHPLMPGLEDIAEVIAHLHVHKNLVLFNVIAYGVCNVARARLRLKLWLEVIVRVCVILWRVYRWRLSWRLHAKRAPRGCACRGCMLSNFLERTNNLYTPAKHGAKAKGTTVSL